MKSFKVLITTALFLASCSAFAQGSDWQIGGGAGSSSRRSDYPNTRIYDPNYSGSVTLYNGGHEDAYWGLVVGYVNKAYNSEYETSGGTFKQSENLFGEKNKRLHGMQLGLQATPCFANGIGAHTGLFYEAYFSESPKVKDSGWDKFTEHDLYIPLHLMYRLPFTQTYSLSFYGGIGFQWAIYGEYRDWGYDRYNYYTGDSYYYGPTEYQKYGDGWPRHVNWQAEAGFNLRFSSFQFGFSYSYGLTNHKLFNNSYGYALKSHQDKLAFNIGIVF